MERTVSIRLNVQLDIHDVDGAVQTANVTVKGNGTVVQNSMIVHSSKYLSSVEPAVQSDAPVAEYSQAVDEGIATIQRTIEASVRRILGEIEGS